MKNKENIVPFIKTGQALQSLRYSGYTLEAAVAEVIDNSIEAKANNINIFLFKGTNSSGKTSVGEIVITDDGNGMTPEQLHFYPQIGYSSRYMREDTIGKYGVGAKLAALAFSTRFDVWSRTNSKGDWSHVYFDLQELLDNDEAGIDTDIKAPIYKPIPNGDWTKECVNKTGTIVSWNQIDRLEDGRLAGSFDELGKNLEKDLARMFRYFIEGGISISVNGKRLLPHDPLYLMEHTYADKILKDYYQKTGVTDRVKDNYQARIIADESIKIGAKVAHLKVTLYPAEVVRKRGLGGDELSRKLQLPENEGSISFIRLNREVAYTTVPKIFPRGVQEADRFIGIEVSFTPELDSYFGVRNVKRGVEPHGELRLDIRNRLKKYLHIARALLDEMWGKEERDNKTKNGEHSSVVVAVKDVNSTMPKGKAKGPEDKSEEEQILKDLASDVTGGESSEKNDEYRDKIKDLPFVIESVDFAGTQFIDIKHIHNQVIIRLNTRHRFYREMWEPVKSIAERDSASVTPEEAIAACKRTIEALTLLIIAYGKAESMDENPDEKYRDLTNYWGQFLHTLLGKVKNVL